MVQRSEVTVTWAGVEGAQPLEVAYLEDPAGVNVRIVEFLTADS